jgi:hypothetical protein
MTPTVSKRLQQKMERDGFSHWTMSNQTWLNFGDTVAIFLGRYFSRLLFFEVATFRGWL